MGKLIRRIYFEVFLSACVAMGFWGCIDERYTTDPSNLLSFSTTDLSFDTVFSMVPSGTKVFLVYNSHSKTIRISSVSLAGDAGSYFRLNVDGRSVEAGNLLSDIDIRAKDSLYVFVEMTSGMQNKNAPILIRDAVLFRFNGQQQQVDLSAYGQDVVIFKQKTIMNDTILTADKPYLVYDYLKIAQGKTLTLAPGSTIYFHKGADLIVNGNLVAEGTLEDPIVLRGDRLDRMNDVDKTPYSYLAGQWGSIFLSSVFGDHRLNNVTIIGSTNALVVTGQTDMQPSLSIKNSRIHLASSYGIYTKAVKLSLINTEISNCGSSCLYLVGGDNSIVHCTIANYYQYDMRTDKAVMISNYIKDGKSLYAYPVQSAVFQNTIIFGDLREELLLKRDSTNNSIPFNLLFHRCLLKATRSNADCFQDNLWSQRVNANANGNTYPDTVFVNTSISNIATTGYYNFELHRKSSARNKANLSVSKTCPTDRNGYSRLSDGLPDIGAYERIEQ